MNFFRNNKGFTLIEMLVATTVSSVILLMVYTAYSSIIRSINLGKTASKYYEEINMVIRRIDTDLVNTYWKESSKNVNFICSVEGNSSRLNFVTGEYKSGKITLNLNEGHPSSDIHEVGYYLSSDKDSNRYNLVRRSEIRYDTNPLEGGFEEIILRNVESVKFDFNYMNDTTDTWDTREKKRLPAGIRTTIVVIDPYNNKDTYEFYSLCNMSYE